MQQVLKATESYKIIRKTKSRLKNKVKSDQNVRFISDSMFLILSENYDIVIYVTPKTNEYGLITNTLATKCGQPRDMAFKVNVSLFRILRVYNGRRQVFNKRLEVY